MTYTLSYKLPISILTVACAFLISCTEKQTEKVTCSVDQSALLENYAQEFERGISECSVEIANLQESFIAFQNGTLDLDAVKAKLKSVQLAYNAISSLDFGPAVVNGEMMNDRFNIFPVNQIQVAENARNGIEDIDNLFKSNVGLQAIEYILFQNETIFGNADWKTNEGGAHLLAQINTLKTRIENLKLAYTSGYSNTFASNTGSGEGSSLALFSNQFIQDFETRLRNNKLRIPIGKFNGGVAQPEKAEAFYSDSGLELASLHFSNIKALYSLNNDSLSLSKYLVCLGESDLDAQITEQLQIVESAYASLLEKNGASLTAAIENYNSDVSNLIDEHQKLVPLLKGNMLSTLGVRINYTDSDGD